MKQMTVTAKIQISVDADNQVLLNKTMSAYSDACNYVSDYIFNTKNLKQFSLNQILYFTLREQFGLRSQMAQSVFKTVIARYKTILETQKKWIKPSFDKPQYDLVWNRDYSLTQNCFSVNTLNGRIKLPYFAKGMSKYFDHATYKFGTAKLVNKRGKYFLHIPVSYEVEESNISDICNVVGIDRGINFVVATYDSKHKSGFVSGRAIKQKRAHYSKLRKELQKRQTPSARRRLKAIGHDVTERVKTKNRYVSVSWSFYDLEQKLIYKAKQNQSTVIKVDPRYTSQCCPVCGHIEKSNRNKKIHLFTCKNCGYESNDDRIGAMNLYHMGISYLKEAQVPDTVTVE